MRQGLCSHLAHLWATSDSDPRSEPVPPPPPPSGKGYVATLPTCGPPLILLPALTRWELLGGKGYLATLPTCGPPLILTPALKRWGPHMRQGLCSHLAHLWATFDSAPCSQAVGTPHAAGVM